MVASKPKVAMTCQYCGKVYYVVASVAVYSRFCSRACRGLAERGTKVQHKIEKICQQCGKVFYVWPVHKGTARFCSRSCTMSSRTGDRHPRKRKAETRTCLNCGKEYTVNSGFERRIKFCSLLCSAKYSFSGERNHKWNGGPKILHCARCGKEFKQLRSGINRRYCSRECTHAGIKVPQTCPGCGKEFLAHPSWLEQGHRYCSITCYRHNAVHPNTIEKAIQDGLTAYGVAFETEYPVGRLHIDIYIPAAKLAVECDGDYWHKDLTEKDKRRDERLRAKGLTVLRLKECDIRKSPEACIKRILSAVAHHH